MKVHLHKHVNPGWYYLAIGSWQPFKCFNHGGWIYLSLNWLWRFGVRKGRL